MRTLASILLLAAAAFCFTQTVRAQGSPYGLIGYGEPVWTTNPRIEGIGGSGTALLDSRTINDLNPATWSWLTRTRLEARMRYNTNKSELGNETSLLHRTKLAGFSFGSSLSESHNIGLALGFAPLGYSDAEMIRADSLATTDYVREGGLSNLFIGLAARPIPAVAIGAKFEYVFGNTRDLAHHTPTDPLAVASTFERDYNTYGMRATFGLAVALDSFDQSLRGITFGVRYSLPASLNVTRRTILTPTNVELDSTIEETGDADYPAALSIGIASSFGDRYRIEADYAAQDFTNAKVFFGAVHPTTDLRLSNSTRYSIGIERLPIMGDDARGISFWDRMGLRLGASYGTLPFKPDTKTAISEMNLSLGFSIPINYESLLDFAITAGTRSPETTAAGPKDTFIRASGSISISERWFTPLRGNDD